MVWEAGNGPGISRKGAGNEEMVLIQKPGPSFHLEKDPGRQETLVGATRG
jgi:hypothetical protein